MNLMPKAAVDLPQAIGLAWGGSELCVALAKRSGAGAVSRDRHSLSVIWVVVVCSVALGVAASYHLREFRLPWPRTVLALGSALFVMGTALRWQAILHLGRFFTTNVAIAQDHQLIDSGPYRLIRHPSYTGSLAAALGFALSFANGASLLVIFVPYGAVILWRIHIEEAALIGALGAKYTDYRRRTKRLIPGVY